MNRTWKHRIIAVGMGIAASLVLCGAGRLSMEERERHIKDQRDKAAKKLSAFFNEQGDLYSSGKLLELTNRQQLVREKGLKAADLDYFLAAFGWEAKDLVICRAIATIVREVKAGKLDEKQTEKVAKEAVKLLKHKDWLVRHNACYLCISVYAPEAMPLLKQMAADDPDVMVREQASKALKRLRQAP